MKKEFKNIIKFSLCSLFFIVVIFIFFELGSNESYALDNSTNYLGDYFLNPEWIEYMELSDEDKNQIEIIPEKFIYKYKNVDTKIKLFNSRSNYPDYYNLNDYGHSTFPNHQYSLGICWSFAGASSMETYMLKNGLSPIDKPIKLAMRQLDYASISEDYIKEGYNPYAYGNRTVIGRGGYLNTPFVLSAYGISPVTADVFGYYNEDKEPKSINEVFNLDNVEYVVDSYVNYGYLDDSSTDSERKNWINEIKNHVMNYGSVSISTVSPLVRHAGSCSYKNNDNYLINVKGECNHTDNNNVHAMAIIGWDDNYQYKYCRLEGETTSDLTNCTNIVSGTGAFILKNSWGDTYPYPYFSYDSNVYGAYGVTGMSLKNWDNNYNVSKVYDSNYEYQISTITYYKSSEIEEKLEKISFYSNSRKEVNYDIYVSSDNDDYVKVDSVVTNKVGLNTIYVDDVLLKGSKFSIKITSDDGYVDQIYAFTSYVDDSADIVFDTFVKTGTEYSSKIEELSFYTATKNVLDGSKIEYKFIDNNGNDISNLVTIENNYVVNNFVKNKVSINGEFPLGDVVLQTIYNGEVYDSITLKVVSLKNLWAGGSGSIEDPFLVAQAEDFKKIFTNDQYMMAHYKLIKDLDFSNIEGWNSGSLTNYQSFSGSLDGNNHKILGLKSDSILPSLFYKVEGATIKNIIFSNINFDMEEYSFGNLLATLSYNSNFSNIVIDKTVNIRGKSSYAGGIVATDYNSSFTNIFNYGNVSSEYDYYGKVAGIVVESYGSKIDECYNYGNIMGTNSIVGGIVSYFGNDSNGNIGTLKNSYNMGVVSSDVYAGGIIGEGENTYIDSIYNIINSDKMGGNSYNIAGSAKGMVIKNSYYLDNSRDAILNDNDSTLVNVIAKNSEQLKEKNTYLNFDFDNVWEIDDSYPYFKNINYYYLNDIEIANDIILNMGEVKNIKIKYSPNNVVNNKLRFEIEDEGIITINDNVVIAIGAGNTNLKIYTTDGSNIVKNIKVTVIDKKINLEDYEIIDEKYIKINSIINKNSFIDSIKTNEYYDIRINGSEENIATGNKLEIYNKEGTLDSEYTIVVLGDVTGTGSINVSDVAKLYQYIKGVIDMEKEYILASDVVMDNQLLVNDVAKLYQYIKKSIESLEE